MDQTTIPHCELTLGARALLWTLQRLAAHQFETVSDSWLATELVVSKRVIRIWKRELATAGLVIVKKHRLESGSCVPKYQLESITNDNQP